MLPIMGDNAVQQIETLVANLENESLVWMPVNRQTMMVNVNNLTTIQTVQIPGGHWNAECLIRVRRRARRGPHRNDSPQAQRHIHLLSGDGQRTVALLGIVYPNGSVYRPMVGTHSDGGQHEPVMSFVTSNPIEVRVRHNDNGQQVVYLMGEPDANLCYLHLSEVGEAIRDYFATNILKAKQRNQQLVLTHRLTPQQHQQFEHRLDQLWQQLHQIPVILGQLLNFALPVYNHILSLPR